jgi:hypothetical protein
MEINGIYGNSNSDWWCSSLWSCVYATIIIKKKEKDFLLISNFFLLSFYFIFLWINISSQEPNLRMARVLEIIGVYSYHRRKERKKEGKKGKSIMHDFDLVIRNNDRLRFFFASIEKTWRWLSLVIIHRPNILPLLISFLTHHTPVYLFVSAIYIENKAISRSN